MHDRRTFFRTDGQTFIKAGQTDFDSGSGRTEGQTDLSLGRTDGRTDRLMAEGTVWKMSN